MDLPLLQSKSRVSSTFIPPHPTQLHPRFARHPIPSPKSASNRNKLLIAAASLFVLLFLFSAALRLHHTPKSMPNHYGVVINAAPNWSQIHVFTELDAHGSSSVKVKPGLPEFSGEPEGAGRMVLELIEFAKDRVPRSEWKNTKVQLMGATELKRVGLEAREAILESCRRVLRTSGFLFKDEWATIIEGQEEALYAWVAANYALGTLGREPQRTTGIVKLGGTSMQVTVSSRESQVVPLSRMIKLSGVTYNLYTESMPYFGQDAVLESLGELHKSKDMLTFSSSGDGIVGNPCVPRGYKFTLNVSHAKVVRYHVAGNFSLCKSKLKELLERRRDKCAQPPCEIVSSSLVKLLGKPLPLDKFFFISEFFGLVPRASLSELEAAGHHYCEDDWYKLKSQYDSIDHLDLLKYCFSSAYVVAMLHDNFGVSMTDKRIGFANQGRDIPSAWIFGAFILQIMQEPLEMERSNEGEIVGNDAVTYLSLFAVFLIAVMGAVFLLKCQKPQLKTVYDLQKGHYIVTRMPR